MAWECTGNATRGTLVAIQTLPKTTHCAQLGPTSRRREHRTATSCCRGGNLLLHHIPVFNDFAVFPLEDIDGDKRLRSPADVASVNHHKIALGNRHADFVGELFF